MMMFLEKFWKGDIAPGEGRYHPREKYSEVMQTMARSREALNQKLDKDTLKLFTEYADAALESACLETCDNFIDGFRMGALMMLDVLKG